MLWLFYYYYFTLIKNQIIVNTIQIIIYTILKHVNQNVHFLKYDKGFNNYFYYFDIMK